MRLSVCSTVEKKRKRKEKEKEKEKRKRKNETTERETPKKRNQERKRFALPLTSKPRFLGRFVHWRKERKLRIYPFRQSGQ